MRARQRHGATPASPGLHALQPVTCSRHACCRRNSHQRHVDRRAAPAQSYLGLDFGTSGARATVIDEHEAIVADVKVEYGDERDWAGTWERSLGELLAKVPQRVKDRLQGIACDGTSATAMLVDRATGQQLAAPRLYNEAQPSEAVAAAKAIAPATHTATASTSTLCKLLAWHLAGVWQHAQRAGAQPCVLHQADWLASLLHGDRGVTDWNNALKLGFDPGAEAYPDWMTSQPWYPLVPQRVLAPGSPAGHVTAAAANVFGLPAGCVVAAGTTDSIAAFVAAGVGHPGEAVTSLGSTMAIKLLSTTRVDDAAFGVYSHRLEGDTWLVGGASNTGGAVLRTSFTPDQLAELTDRMDISQPTGLDFYPLTRPGERFPINDPGLLPRLEPRPADDVQFLQGMLEGMARIEGHAYAVLYELGARPRVSRVLTAGGGAVNAKWAQLRAQAIGVPVLRAQQGEASFGAALLAKKAASRSRSRSVK